ncbi:hypothetical protein [Pelosinus sp. IPA-1]|uniref:hypothetical protein n=1 Tax=Pelosinus sp. IPA-1 TaxID=3029569 RepID=UPI0024361619|nr:hypothetical protein [Pelosinus sp. IPA-1]GMA99467.1 hypothetical protein PIPA1_22670 [Pelosinus sp. IPA-1]
MYWLIEIVLVIIVVQVLQGGFFVYLLLRELRDMFARYRKEGVIKQNKLKYTIEENQEISLNHIELIEGGYDRSLVFPSTVFVDVNTSDCVRKICLDDDEIVKLAKTHLNQINISTKWDFDKKLISITPQINDEMMCITYDPVGKYALTPYLPNVLGFITFAVFGVGLYFHIVASYALFAILAIICFIPPFYKQVSVMINSEGIQIKDENGERFIGFKEIYKVEKSIFRMKIITKNSEVVYFPKACYLLPEFIAEMTKCEV